MTSVICANNTNPTPGVNDGESGAFNQYMWGDLVLMTNLFSGSANGGPVGVSTCFDVPIENGPDFLPDNSGCYQNNGTIEGGQCKISFTGQNSETAGGVRGYPAFVLGSRGGCHETWGVACGLVPALMPGTRDNNCPIYDLNVAQNAVGYPQFSGQLPDSTINIDSSDCGAPGTYNTFTDTYWHDVSDTSLLPLDTAGNPIASLQNTINGVNVRDTAMWNLNFWYYHPDLNNITTYTGGTKVTSSPIAIGGCLVDIVVKHETGGNNNFFYLAFVLNPSKTTVSLDYNAFANWVQSPAFLTTVYNHPASQQICADMASPANAAKPKTCRPPDGNFVVDSLQVGNEMWGTDTAAATEICYDALNFVVDGQTFGKGSVIEPEPEPEPEPEVCSDSSTVSVIVDSTCTRSSVIIDCGGCTCTPYDLVQISTVDWDCIPLGGYITYQTGGCDCGCDDPFKQCGPMGWYYKYQPDWVHADTVCLENGILTIGPKKGRLEPNVAVQCSFCADSDCP